MSEGADGQYKVCQEKLNKILKLLSHSSSTFGYSVTLKFAADLLYQLIAKKKVLQKTEHQLFNNFVECLNQYEALLTKINETGKWKKLVSSNKMRKLDQLDTALYNITSELSKETSLTLVVNLLKEDDDAQKMWEEEFGMNTLIVSWANFLEGLRKHVEVRPDVVYKLKWILDRGHTGYVSLFKFSELLKSFGAFKTCLLKVAEILDYTFFYGFITSVESEVILSNSPAGTYLVRFSTSKSGSFALSYVDQNQQAKHCIIECLSNGFIINELFNQNVRDRVFTSLTDLFNCYSKILKSPLNCPLAKESFFHGDISTEDSNELLEGQPDGTFLFRLCNQVGHLALSIVLDSTSKNALIGWRPEGFYHSNDSTALYPTLSALVKSRPDQYRYPVGNSRTLAGYILVDEDGVKKNVSPNLLEHEFLKQARQSKSNNTPSLAYNSGSLYVALNNSGDGESKRNSPGSSGPRRSSGDRHTPPSDELPEGSPSNSILTGTNQPPKTLVPTEYTPIFFDASNPLPPSANKVNQSSGNYQVMPKAFPPQKKKGVQKFMPQISGFSPSPTPSPPVPLPSPTPSPPTNGTHHNMSPSSLSSSSSSSSSFSSPSSILTHPVSSPFSASYPNLPTTTDVSCSLPNTNSNLSGKNPLLTNRTSLPQPLNGECLNHEDSPKPGRDSMKAPVGAGRGSFSSGLPGRQLSHGGRGKTPFQIGIAREKSPRDPIENE